MGVVTTSSERLFRQPAQTIYDFVSNPANWPRTYPGSAHIGGLGDHLPLKVGDTWTESGPDGERIFTWHLAMAVPARLWVFNSVGRLGHDADGHGGLDGRITVQYRFTEQVDDGTLFTRTMTIEAYKHAPLPDALFTQTNPANIDSYLAAVARELT